MPIEDNVAPFPSAEERRIKRAMHAREQYAAAVAIEAKGRVQAIDAVIEYGAALLDGREAYPGHQAFAAWVTKNGLDQGSPWDKRPERSCAMKIAEIVSRSGPTNEFTECPNTRPTDIMSWWRRRHPDEVRPQKPRADKDAATQKAMTAIEEMAAAGEVITEGKIEERAGVGAGTANKAFNIYRKTKEAADKATAETTAKLTEDQALARAEFSEKSKMTIAKAIALHKKRLEKSFWTTVGVEVRKGIKEADQAVREHLARLQKQEIYWMQEQRRRGVFTKTEFRQLIMCCHPDASASPEVRARLTDILVKNEKRLVIPDPAK